MAVIVSNSSRFASSAPTSPVAAACDNASAAPSMARRPAVVIVLPPAKGASRLRQRSKKITSQSRLTAASSGEPAKAATTPNLAALGQDAVDIGRGDCPGLAGKARLAVIERGLHDRVLARVEVAIERDQQAAAGGEVIVDHRLGDASPLGEAAERQGVGAFLADDPPGGRDELALAIFARQALTARPFGIEA